MDLTEAYLRSCNQIHTSGAATAEQSFYPALAQLLKGVGQELSPIVHPVLELKNSGAGNPDGGLFTEQQINRDEAPLFDDGTFDAPSPGRGAIEVKSPGADLDALQASDQVQRYLDRYGLVLITNLRAFRLLGEEPTSGHTGPRVLEEFALADSESTFWQLTQNASPTPPMLKERFIGFLKRALTRNAPLRQPADVAALLASYARDARLRLSDASITDLDHLRTSLEEVLGIEYRGDQSEGFFRSTIVQTLFYGLFSAWVIWHREEPGRTDDFDWHQAHEYLRVPIVQRLFFQAVGPSQLRKLRLLDLMNWAQDALNRVDRPAFFAEFNDREAVQYFYEPFLERFDPDLRKQLGVWYTPQEIVDYQVQRVDTVLREELNISDGLADDNVIVLDPCCGTGAYLVAVLRFIAKRLREQGSGALTAATLRKAATERIFGFELLTAPYVVAHLQIGLFLAEMGAPLIDTENERAAVYLTNALTGWKADEASGGTSTFPEFKAERLAAERVKQESPILVILGNPPYKGHPGIAIGEERNLSDAYRDTDQAPKPQGRGLNDLYIRFFRIAERQIVKHTEKGVVCYISNYSWLDGLSHTGMRERYLKVFDQIWIDNLNGDKYRTGKTTPDGDADPSVFSTSYNRAGIQVGTAVSLLCRSDSPSDGDGQMQNADLRYREFWGEDKKSDLLASITKNNSVSYDTLNPPVQIGYPLVPRTVGKSYLSWPRVTEIYEYHTPGVFTARDSFVVDTDLKELHNRIKTYFDKTVSDSEMSSISPRSMKETRRFSPKEARSRLQERGILKERFTEYLYRPFDSRWLYWEPETKLLDEKRSSYMPHVIDENLWFCAAQQLRKEFDPPVATRLPASLHVIERGANFFPLFLNPDVGGGDLFSQPGAGVNEGEPIPNLTELAKEYLASVTHQEDVETLFYHTIAVLHAPTYRLENEGALRQDWPRVPLPQDTDALNQSAALGREVAALLDVEADVSGVTTGSIRDELKLLGKPEPSTPERDQLGTNDFRVTAGWGYTAHHGATMPGGGETDERDLTADEDAAMPDRGVELWGNRTLDVYLNEDARWRHIPIEVWEYTLGGYPVIKKWLSYREEDVLGRPLKLEEVQHVTHMTRRIAALLLLNPRLDANYEHVKATTES